MASSAAKQMLKLLAERYPAAFPQDPQQIRPLKIGIHEDLIRELPDESPEAIKSALTSYVGRPPYLGVLKDATHRIDQYGNVVEEVDEGAREKARRRYEKWLALEEQNAAREAAKAAEQAEQAARKASQVQPATAVAEDIAPAAVQPAPPAKKPVAEPAAQPPGKPDQQPSPTGAKESKAGTAAAPQDQPPKPAKQGGKRPVLSLKNRRK